MNAAALFIRLPKCQTDKHRGSPHRFFALIYGFFLDRSSCFSSLRLSERLKENEATHVGCLLISRV